MQLHITFKGENTVLPIAYRYFIQSMIYRALETDKKFSQFLHDGGFTNDDKSFKLFTFSPLKGNYSVRDKKIIFSDYISFEIRSFEPAIIQLLIHAFAHGNKVNIGRNTLTVEKCILKNKTIYMPQVKIKMIAPATAYVTRDFTNRIYFSPDDDEFNQLIINNAKRKWLSAGKNEHDFKLDIEKAEEIPLKKEVTDFKKHYIIAWYAGFVLKGNPEVINFLYNTGLGSKNSQGFGMYELIK